MSFYERQTRRHLSDRRAISGRLDTNGHGLSIALGYQDVLDACELESALDLQQVLLIPGMQSYRDSVLTNPDWGRFSSSVNGLGNLRPMGEVGPNNDVVDKIRIGVAIAGLPIVNDSRA